MQNTSNAYKHRLYTFPATESSFGKTIAISYLKQETTPKRVITDINN